MWILLFLSILLFNSVAFFMKKRIKISEIYVTVIFALLVCAIVDVYASYRFKAWGFFDVGKAEFSVMLIFLGIYPAVSAIIINWYPFQSAWWKKFIYLMSWGVFSTAYEWLTLKLDIIWHMHWNLYYSFLLYPIMYYICLILHIRLYRRIKKREELSPSSCSEK